MKTSSPALKIAILVLILGFLAPVGEVLAQDDLPKQAYVSGLVGRPQSYGLTCESRSASDLAAFWGVSVSETEFFSNLPRSDNPEKGFVGNPNDSWGQIPPNSYGVHAKPVAKLLRQYGLNAEAQYGLSWYQLRREIAFGRPVIVWVIGGVWSGTPQTYVAQDGSQVTVAAFEHTMIFIGYDQSLVHLVDAGSGNTVTHPISNFLTSWGVLGNMAVIVNGLAREENEQPEAQPDPPKPTNPGETYLVQPGDYLKKLADEWGVAWQDIAALNGISYPYVIYTGQALKVPGGGSPVEKEPAPTKEAGEPKKSPATYTVKPGEYLMQIARELSLDWRTLADLNGLYPPYVLYPGQILLLPASNSDEPAKDKPANTPAPNKEGVPKTYTVERGDYLVAIARQFGLNWLEIAALNGVSYPYVVYPGQVLRLR